MKMMKENITSEQYLKIFEDAKSAVLYDMDSFDMDELHNPQKPVFSVLGVTLRCRDDEDAFWVIGYNVPKLFLRFNPNLMKYMKEQSRCLLEDDEPFKESARNKLYWEVTKYTKINNAMEQMYTAYFSLDCELIDLHSAPLPKYKYRQNIDVKLSDAQQFLFDSSWQLFYPVNVEVTYQPGDILHVDANPFVKPFCVVYGAETDEDRTYLEWKLQDAGYHQRTHPCLYISEDRNGLVITDLTAGDFTIDRTVCWHTPFERITVVEKCDSPVLMKISSLLKEDPRRFNTWLALTADKRNHGKSLEKLILGDEWYSQYCSLQGGRE